MFSNTSQTQRKVLHLISCSAFNVLNIMMGIGYISERRQIIRIIYTFLKLHQPECIQPKQSLTPPPPPPPQHPPLAQLLWTTHSFSAAARNLLHLSSWLQTSSSFNCDFFLKPQIFSSLLIKNQPLMQAAHNKCFMEDDSFYKLIRHNETSYYQVYVTAVK
jgi:hypothetical protein